jgi:uncharacterized protein (TIGR03083 family)
MAYNLDYRTLDEIRDELSATRRVLNAVLDQVGDRWDAPVYSEGAAWNVRQLLMHLAITDQAHNNMVMGFAEGREIVPADFDVERYNRRSVEKRADMTPEQARQSLAESRGALLQWLDGVTDESVYEKTGRHGSMNIYSIRQILRLMGQHEQNHALDIARVLGIEPPADV